MTAVVWSLSVHHLDKKNIILYFSSQNGSIYLTHFVSFIIMLWFAARSASPDLESFLKEQQQSEL